MIRKYFSAESSHGSESSYGFANDIIVRVFASRKSRDRYVENSTNLSCRTIKAEDATKEAANYSLTQNREIRPRPFTGEYWGIVMTDADALIGGCLGTVEVCRDGEPFMVCRLSDPLTSRETL